MDTKQIISKHKKLLKTATWATPIEVEHTKITLQAIINELEACYNITRCGHLVNRIDELAGEIYNL